MSLVVFSVALASVAVSPSSSSIRFDEVEFYNPNYTLDESTSNGFQCAHLGEQCQITAQCCGVATCALPSWSESPVCLVPGYKHDDRFKNRFYSLHNLQPEDIRYIRDSYNTSQYDFLLTDLTFSAPPLNDFSNSSRTGAANATVSDERFDDFDGSHSPVSTSAEYSVTNDRIKNVSSGVNLELFENKLNESENSSSFYGSSVAIDGYFPKINSTNPSTDDDFGFKSRFMFLIINNTVEQNPELDLKEFYDQAINTDRFKKVVEKLKEKMRRLNEIENNFNNDTMNTTFSIRRETVQPTTEKMKTTKKLSKWSVVKKFFFHNKEMPNGKLNSTDIEQVNYVDEIVNKQKPSLKNKKCAKEKTILQSSFSIIDPEKEEFKHILEDVDKIEEIIDRDEKINKYHGSKTIKDEGSADFYNIDVPIASLNIISRKDDEKNNSLESVFKDIGDTINSMIIDSVDNRESELNRSLIMNYSQENNVHLNSKENYVLNQTNMAKYGGNTNQTHFWNKIHFWRFPKNFSAEVENGFKKIFATKKGSSKNEKTNITTPLNEFFLLNLNSKNSQDNVTRPQKEQTESTSEYHSLSSSESESTSSEELYNNSYVFMVNKEHLEKPVTFSGWKRVLNFFHKEKTVPLSFDIDIRDGPVEGSSDEGKIYSECNPGVEVSNIIRLPEYLMPQALDERQGNETNWIFEDSEDIEDGMIEEHKSSNSSFFFFFRQ